jgi:ketosteroid isomerase-like protein
MRPIVSALLSFLLLCLPVASQGGSEAESEIRGVYEAWRTAVEAGSIAGYVAVLHPDIALRPPGVPGLNGRDNYAEFLGPVFATATYEITIDNPPAVVVLGDTAVVEYDYTILRHPTSGATDTLAPGALVAVKTSAHYIDIVAKDSAGEWKVRLHSWQDWPEGSPQ